MILCPTIKLIAFDADDTLWVNEPFYRETEKKFTQLLADYLPEEQVSQQLFETETKNIQQYGYGVKGFVLSMIETALKITNDKVEAKIIQQILNLGKSLIRPPMELLEGVEHTLQNLNMLGLTLVLATKGDLLDQERKLERSGLASCFHHIEIMSNKNETDYLRLLNRLNILPSEFLMIGNSVKSDILPVLAIGGYAVHVPYHTTWAHEMVVNNEQNHDKYLEISSISGILNLIRENENAFLINLNKENRQSQRVC
ncbi:MAG TPA: HAD family hydrolase [Bacteroidales bacterium]|nr:HAD family hydrolase [Bacteroidales bacterium]